MASIQPRISRGKKYWSIVESRRIDGKPRTVILEYLGTSETLLQRLREEKPFSIKSYSHGDIRALLDAAIELDVIPTINKHIPNTKTDKQVMRDGMSVGASFLLAAIGRACHPTSKMGWYEWCKETSLEYCLGASFKNLTSQHFWDQMEAMPSSAIPLIEEELVVKLVEKYQIKLDCLFFDTTNFFTFIDSVNEHCKLPDRGKNKQKRFDLRQVGMALLVSKKEQFPLFHHTYQGNQNDITTFKEIYVNLVSRLKKITKELTDITLIFDKGNNSKDNFKMLDEEKGLHYVGGLVPSYFKDLIKKANKNFSTITIEGEELPAYRIKTEVWGELRTCVVTVSKQLKEGQIRGIHQHLEKKYKVLEEFKQQIESPKRRKQFNEESLKERLNKIIKGQFIEEILMVELIELKDGSLSFTYHLDADAFKQLQNEILGRQIVVTNRHDWSSEEILLAYRGQSKVEYAFRNLKNPYHCAVRPQYHWTDQKIEAHFLMCIIGYLLTVAVYTKAKEQAGYNKNLSRLMDELKKIRLTCITKKKSNKVTYQLENIPVEMRGILKALRISNDSIRIPLNAIQ